MTNAQQTSERIIQVIFGVVDELNEQMPQEKRLEKSVETALFGRSGNLDSLGLVTMIVAVEQQISEEFGVEIVLAGEEIMSQGNNSFETIGSLVHYVSILLMEKSDGQEI